MIVDKLQDTLGGGYEGLRGEIEDLDVYQVRHMDDIVSINDPNYVHVKGHKRRFDFTPDLVFDFGANVGIFSRYMRKLYPSCTVIAVEPDKENFAHLEKFTDDPGVVKLNAAIGIGQVYQRQWGAVNGAHECFLSTGSVVLNDQDFKPVNVPSFTLAALMVGKVHPDMKIVAKIDIEGNESVLLSHRLSMEALKTIDYIVMELHWMDKPEVSDIVIKAMEELRETHDVEYEHIYLYATKRKM